jgi:PIN domain nuclease of toxin-antitoxin system
MVHFITWTSISIFEFNLCAILTKIQPTTAFKIYIYSAPKSTDVTFQNLESKF